MLFWLALLGALAVGVLLAFLLWRVAEKSSSAELIELDGERKEDC